MSHELLSATDAVPRITLRDGTRIPQLGFGTLNVPPDRAPTAENIAITAGIVRPSQPASSGRRSRPAIA